MPNSQADGALVHLHIQSIVVGNQALCSAEERRVDDLYA